MVVAVVSGCGVVGGVAVCMRLLSLRSSAYDRLTNSLGTIRRASATASSRKAANLTITMNSVVMIEASEFDIAVVVASATDVAAAFRRLYSAAAVFIKGKNAKIRPTQKSCTISTPTDTRAAVLLNPRGCASRRLEYQVDSPGLPMSLPRRAGS